MDSSTTAPISFRPRTTRRSTSFSTRSSSHSLVTNMIRRLDDLKNKGLRIFWRLTPLQRVALVAVGTAINILGILSLIYHEAVFDWLTSFSKGWREITGGWLILWALTFGVSFPPLIGYSTCVMLGGYVYGFPNGWFIVATASTCGATVAFLTSRSLFKSYVDRIVASDPRFTAFAMVLKHDGLKFLCMIRLCPLPFSISNGALSTIPTISWQTFMLATACVTPKLLLHVWIGAQLADLAERGDEMDTKTKVISYFGIAIGAIAGGLTTWLIYSKMQARMHDIAELERAENAGVSPNPSGYDDDPDLAEAAEFLREQDDDISLRDAWDDDYHDECSDGFRSGGVSRNPSPLPRR